MSTLRVMATEPFYGDRVAVVASFSGLSVADFSTGCDEHRVAM